MQRAEVYAAVDGEREHQDWKWGTPEQHPHEVGGWLLIMEQLLADARKQWTSEAGDHRALIEVRKVAAVAVACMEQHGVTPRPARQPGAKPAHP